MPEWVLASRAESVAHARRLAVSSLPGLSTAAAQAVALIVSELATNCVRHAGTEFRLRVTPQPQSVRIEVTDAAGGRPALRNPAPTEPHGRGLQIVQVLATRWGVQADEGNAGKTVWCTVAV
ncbi:MAG TPA: ATP-binding protein [Jatrophihabitans sp.]|nr:ATP-binding protein [Jatrophihabitans sp.]